MSSQVESSPASSGETQPVEKKRRVRACDVCRRRKVRCDGGRGPDHPCTNCQTFKYTCTYTHFAKKRFSDPEYVENLELKLAQTQELLHQLSERLNAPAKLNKSSSSENVRSSATNSTLQSHMSGRIPITAHTRDTPVDDDDIDSSDDEFPFQESLDAKLKSLCLGTCHPQFLGKSSTLSLLREAVDAKQEYYGTVEPTSRPVTRHSQMLPLESWVEHDWMMQSHEQRYPPDNFPEYELTSTLVDLYFTYVNSQLPVLHRPTFEKGIREGLHLRNEGFGSTVLLVCAIGSRFSDDPRVFSAPGNEQSAGWHYFLRVQNMRRAIQLAPPTLYDVQIPVFFGIFLFGAPYPQACFAAIGTGIRMAQDLGAHRRKAYKNTPTPEGELLKRAFWALVGMDRNLSSALGRPCCIQEEDYDVDLPIECDDEYWYPADPDQAFKQPPGKPSKISFFTHFIKLNQIHSCALRTIYAINKSKARLGLTGPQWEQHTVAELDSRLNEWMDSIPDHLRWDPQRENIVFLNQSALLWSLCHTLQIIVHRQYIPSAKRLPTFSFPSLTICTNAARSSIHILEVQHQRCPKGSFHNILALFNAGVVLVINIWGSKRAGLSSNPSKDMEEVNKSMKILQHLAPRWFVAGRVLGALTELATVGDLPVPNAGPAPSLKRGRDGASSASLTPGSDVSTTSSTDLRPIVGSSRVQQSFGSSRPSPTGPSHNTNGGASFPLSTGDSGLAPFPRNSTFDITPSVPSYTSSSVWELPISTIPCFESCGPACTADGLASQVNATGLQSQMFFSEFRPDASLPISPQAVSDPWQNEIDGQGGAATGLSEFDTETLNLLSAAPNSMEWNDWGAYITNFSGYGVSIDDPRPQGL